ncbi:hypothetical protein K2X30_11345 [bacterium]|jgi:hypothetical protein|nr:hypothetical protein [bacterium]
MKLWVKWVPLLILMSTAARGGEVALFGGIATPIDGNGRLEDPRFSVWFNPEDLGTYLGIRKSSTPKDIDYIQRNSNSSPGTNINRVGSNGEVIIHSTTLYNVKTIDDLVDPSPAEVTMGAKASVTPHTETSARPESVVFIKKPEGPSTMDRLVESFRDRYGDIRPNDETDLEQVAGQF